MQPEPGSCLDLREQTIAALEASERRLWLEAVTMSLLRKTFQDLLLASWDGCSRSMPGQLQRLGQCDAHADEHLL